MSTQTHHRSVDRGWNHGAVLLIGMVVLLCTLTGCRSEREHRLSQLGRNGPDPLRGEMTIPSPNVPTGRDMFGSKESRDPLYRNGGATTATEARGGNTADRPWRPNWKSTPGALASGDGTAEFSDLRIPKRDTSNPGTRGGSNDSTVTLTSLERLGAKVFDPIRTENGVYEVRVQVPVNTSGAMSSYIGSGSTPAAALDHAYRQARNDVK
jgi:hypothetical protein